MGKTTLSTGPKRSMRTRRDLNTAESLEELNKKLAASKAARLKAAEENCIKLTGKNRF